MNCYEQPLGKTMIAQRTSKFFNHLSLSLGLFLIANATGCSICCQPYLEDYVTFGSRTPRADMKYGRVGSPFSDPAMHGTVGEYESTHATSEYYVEDDGSWDTATTIDLRDESDL